MLLRVLQVATGLFCRDLIDQSSAPLPYVNMWVLRVLQELLRSFQVFTRTVKIYNIKHKLWTLHTYVDGDIVTCLMWWVWVGPDVKRWWQLRSSGRWVDSLTDEDGHRTHGDTHDSADVPLHCLLGLPSSCCSRSTSCSDASGVIPNKLRSDSSIQ